MSAPGSPSSRKRPADDGSDGSGTKKARVGTPDAASNTPADDFEEGEIGESPSGSPAASIKDEAEDESTPAQGGWNRGVSSGLRTSFISLSTSKSLNKKSQKSPKKESSPDTTPERRTGKHNTTTRSQTRSLPKDKIVVDGWLSLPPHEPFAHFRSRPRYPDSWQKRFMDFCEATIRHNIRWPQVTMDEDQAKKMNNPDLLYKAWGRWLQDHADQRFCTHDQLTAGVNQASTTRVYTHRLEEVISEALSGKGQELEEPKTKPQQQGKFPHTSWTTFDRRGTRFEKLVIPPLDSKSDLDNMKKDNELWRAKFLEWARKFINLNPNRLTSKTPELLGVLWTSWVDWFKQIVGKNKIPIGKDVARKFFLAHYEDVATVYHAIMKDKPTPVQGEAQDEASEPSDHEEAEEAADEETEELQEAVPARNGELQQLSHPTTPRDEEVDLHTRHTYFCGLEHNQLFCVECASTSHDSSQCPLHTCRWCKVVADHPSYACPTRRRCTQCRQLGHDDESCTEKLALPRDQMTCAICDSSDHLEETCVELWRTYKPDPLTTSKVKALPIYCYCCGNAGHYGADCGMNQARPSTITVWETWSKSNAEQLYTDADSENVAPSLKPMPKGSVLAAYNEDDPYADWDADSNGGRPDFGHSIAPQRHVFFEDDEDDEEDEGFIRPSVAKNNNQGGQSHGKINFGGNRGGQGKRGGGTGGQRHNPPLPPGPPPQRLREFQSYNHGRGSDTFQNGPSGGGGRGGGRGGGGGGGRGGRGGFGRGPRGGRSGKNQWSRGHH